MRKACYANGICAAFQRRKVVKAMVTEVFGQLGITASAVETFFKGTGILGGVAVAIYLCIKYKVVILLAVDSATEVVRVRWGVERYYRFGPLKGRLIRLRAGRHLLIRGIHHGWEVSLKEVVLPMVNVDQPFRGYTLTFDGITVGYEVIAPDTAEGDETLLRSIKSVRDGDRVGQVSENLDQKVIGIVKAGLGPALKQATPDEFGLPEVDLTTMKAVVGKKLRKRHGVRLISFEASAPTWTQGTQQIKAAQIIARALLGKTESDVLDVPAASGDADVLPLPVHTTA